MTLTEKITPRTFYSSPQTFIFKYIFPFIFLSFGIIGFMTFKNDVNEAISNFANVFGIALVWSLYCLIQMSFRLKNIEIDENGLKIKTGGNQIIIPFINIMSVSKLDLSNPCTMTIKFFDPNKNENRKIAYIPKSKYQRFMKEDEMTEFLIMQAKSKNPNYEEVNTMRNLLILILVGIPFWAGIIYFILKSDLTRF